MSRVVRSIQGLAETSGLVFGVVGERKSGASRAAGLRRRVEAALPALPR